jgi:hypothetical protein
MMGKHLQRRPNVRQWKSSGSRTGKISKTTAGSVVQQLLGQAPFAKAVSLGFCNGTGLENYNRLVVDKPAPFSCDKDTQENSVTSVLAYGNGRFQNQKLTLKTGEHTGQPQICVSGTIMKAGFEPPYNICIVIDISGSTSGSFGGTPPGDVNKDVSFVSGRFAACLSNLTSHHLQGRSNTILDAEIGAALAVLQYIATSPDLGNSNVQHRFGHLLVRC